jgi:hypothetical protein
VVQMLHSVSAVELQHEFCLCSESQDQQMVAVLVSGAAELAAHGSDGIGDRVGSCVPEQCSAGIWAGEVREQVYQP